MRKCECETEETAAAETTTDETEADAVCCFILFVSMTNSTTFESGLTATASNG